jgi:hypothetical protein
MLQETRYKKQDTTRDLPCSGGAVLDTTGEGIPDHEADRPVRCQSGAQQQVNDSRKTILKIYHECRTPTRVYSYPARTKLEHLEILLFGDQGASGAGGAVIWREAVDEKSASFLVVFERR